MTPYTLKPNPGDNRTWTREKWKQAHRYCRLLTPTINDHMRRMEPAISKALYDLALYGFTTVKVVAQPHS